MTDATVESAQTDTPRESERELRREYRLSFSAKVTIFFAGALVIYLNLAKYGHEEQLWWWFPNVASVQPQDWVHLVEITLFVVDGAAKAAILSFAATFILRIDIKKFVERVIHAQPLLADPAEGERLRSLLKGEIASLSRKLVEAEDHRKKLEVELDEQRRDLEGNIAHRQRAIDGLLNVFGQFESLTKQANALRDNINRA